MLHLTLALQLFILWELFYYHPTGQLPGGRETGGKEASSGGLAY